MIFFKNPFNTWGKSQIHPLSPKKNVKNVKTVTSAHKGAMCCLSGLPLTYRDTYNSIIQNLKCVTSWGVIIFQTPKANTHWGYKKCSHPKANSQRLYKI